MSITTRISSQTHDKQEHPRGSIVEPQVLHQEGLNYLSCSGLETPIIIAHVYELFQVGVVLNIVLLRITRLTHIKLCMIIIGPIHMKS